LSSLPKVTTTLLVTRAPTPNYHRSDRCRPADAFPAPPCPRRSGNGPCVWPTCLVMRHLQETTEAPSTRTVRTNDRWRYDPRRRFSANETRARRPGTLGRWTLSFKNSSPAPPFSLPGWAACCFSACFHPPGPDHSRFPRIFPSTSARASGSRRS